MVFAFHIQLGIWAVNIKIGIICQSLREKGVVMGAAHSEKDIWELAERTRIILKKGTAGVKQKESFRKADCLEC